MNKTLEQMFRLHGVRGWRLFCAHTWREVLPFVLSCARAVIGMSWKAGVAAELIGMAVGTVGERIYQAKLLIETADLLAWTVLVVAASWACERVLVWLLRVSGPVAWQRGRAGARAWTARACGGCERWRCNGACACRGRSCALGAGAGWSGTQRARGWAYLCDGRFGHGQVDAAFVGSGGVRAVLRWCFRMYVW